MRLLPTTAPAVRAHFDPPRGADPRHPSLHFKRVKRFHSVGVDAPDGVLWFWIGSHADYDRAT
jgi:hypothetical protein